MEIHAITFLDNPSFIQKERISRFILDNSCEQDLSYEIIWRSVDYALSLSKNQGGFILLAKDDGDITGALVINRTSMEDYIPENILIHLVIGAHVNKNETGLKLLRMAVELTNGKLAVRLNKDHPDRSLYEVMGFRERYIEYQLLGK
jgi:[ribosomal protein S18]-alanine N-acetyltransferase